MTKCKTNNPHGRPPKYKAEYAQIAKQVLSIGGTDADLAIAFRVNVTTIWRWKAAHSAFLQAYKQGAAFSDDRVEASFYKRAVGYERRAVKICSYEGRSWEHEYIEEVPPDPRAGEFWLRNRRPDRWKDAKQLETRVADNDPFLAFLKSINGSVMRPVEQDNPAIEVEYAEVKAEPEEDDEEPPRLLGGPR